MVSCVGKKSWTDDEVLDELKWITSEYISDEKLCDYSNGRLSSIIDIWWLTRLMDKSGGLKRLTLDIKYHLSESLLGIPRNHKKRCILAHFPGLKEAIRDEVPHFYEHLLAEMGVPRGGPASGPIGPASGVNSHPSELEFCPTFSEGFLGLEEERGNRPVPVSKMSGFRSLTTSPTAQGSPLGATFTAPNHQFHTSPDDVSIYSDDDQKLAAVRTDGWKVPTTGDDSSYLAPIPVTQQIGISELAPLPPYNRVNVDLDGVPSNIRNDDAAIDSSEGLATTTTGGQGGFTVRQQLSMADLISGDLPNLAHSVSKRGKNAPHLLDKQVLSWLDLNDKNTSRQLSTTQSRDLGITETSAFFSCTNLNNYNAVVPAGLFNSPVGIQKPKCIKKLTGRTMRYRMKVQPPALRPKANNNEYLWSTRTSFWSGPPRPENQLDRRFAVEGTTEWSQLLTPLGLSEVRRQLWCLENSLNLEFCPAIPLLIVSLFSFGFDKHETFTCIHQILSKARHSELVPQTNWITRRKTFIIHVQFCTAKLKLICPSLEAHLATLGFDLSAWMARHLQELLGSLLQWSLLTHLIYATIFSGAKIPIGYLITLIAGHEGALLICSSLKEVGVVLGARQNMVNNWYIHMFGTPKVDDDVIMNTFIWIANRTISKMSSLSVNTLRMSTGAKLTPYLMEITSPKLYRVRFRSMDEAPPNGILTVMEWSAMWHALHPIYRTCMPLRCFNMRRDGDTITSINRAIANWNMDSQSDNISHYSCCLLVLKV
eukprot:GHVH01005652.1.p1 GENE.GHVH01005652.1~~GHVH01005652.1.p1  ORF type:complete len:766 (-),score=95.34 GHVH01005652.1:704-3001(-)